MSNVLTITVDELAERLALRDVAEFWNVLTDDYFTGELIPGSRHVPLDHVGREVGRIGLAKDAPVVVYCSGPTCPMSRTAAEKLVTLGYTDVRAFEGGLEAWRHSGRALEALATSGAA